MTEEEEVEEEEDDGKNRKIACEKKCSSGNTKILISLKGIA